MVYVILLNYNGHSDTIECLESLYKTESVKFQVIIVDNSEKLNSLDEIENWAKGKTDINNTKHSELVYPKISKPTDYIRVNEAELLKKKYSNKLILVKAHENKGFSAGNNIALRYALKNNDFSYCWLLNNDTVVESSSLKNLVLYAEENELGITGSVLYDYGKHNSIQTVGGKINKYTSFSSDILDLNEISEIDYVVGASLLVSAPCLKIVDLLDEQYFLYYEDADFCFRAIEKEFKVGICPLSRVYHKHGASIGASNKKMEKSEALDIIYLKSRILFHRRHLSSRLGLYIAFTITILNRVKRIQIGRIPKLIRLLFE